MASSKSKFRKGMRITGLILLALIAVVAVVIGIFFYLRNRINHHKVIRPHEDSGEYRLNAVDGIQLLENGLSVVRYDGDYGFDTFLTQGGATNDTQLRDYILKLADSEAGMLDIKTENFGCSTLYVPRMEGNYFFGRNFDFISCNAMIVEAHPASGYSSVSTVDLDFIHLASRGQSLLMDDELLTLAALYVPLDGMNEKGVCMSVNMIQDGRTIEQNTGKSGITTTTAIRLVLDRAASVDEAIALLSEYDMHASFHFMVHFAIADAYGNSVVVEYVNNEMVVTKTPVVTNFYLHDGPLYGIGTAQSMERYQILTDTLSQKNRMTSDEVKEALESVCKKHYDDGETTEWSAVFDLEKKTVCYYHREDYSKGYLIRPDFRQDETKDGIFQ